MVWQMKILVTGAGGFIGKNFIWTAKAHDDMEILAYHHGMDDEALEKMCMACDAVVHLAGVNRPKDEQEFSCGNVDFTRRLISFLSHRESSCPIIFSSSTQAMLDNPYGRSKTEAEDVIRDYGETRGGETYIYRLPNVFGKWCRPNYNSAVATFCHNIARDLPITVNDESKEMNLVYIDDVINTFIDVLMGKKKPLKDSNGFCSVPVTYKSTVGKIAKLIREFRDCRKNIAVPDMDDEFTKKLYSTYLSYLPKDGFGYELLSHEDIRGSFTEFMRTMGQGQFSVNVSKPHIVKGGHYHQSKHEKFLVVHGSGVIRLRRVDSDGVLSYAVSDKKLEVVEIPPGYTHEIENTGDTDMVTLMWANENYDPDKPDTYRMEV